MKFKLYNVFIAPLLTPELYAADGRVLKGMMRGKADWITPAQILHMKSWHNFPNQPLSIEHNAIAAKVRLFEEDAFFKGREGQRNINETLHSGTEGDNGETGLLSYGNWIHWGIFEALQLARTRVKGTPVMEKIRTRKQAEVGEEEGEGRSKAKQRKVRKKAGTQRMIRGYLLEEDKKDEILKCFEITNSEFQNFRCRDVIFG